MYVLALFLACRQHRSKRFPLTRRVETLCGGCRGVLHRAPPSALQPQERKADDRSDDIAVEHDPGVAGREIMMDHHLTDMADRRAPEEAGGPHDGGDPHLAAALEREKSNQREAEARVAHFRLERTVGPADEFRRQF